MLRVLGNRRRRCRCRAAPRLSPRRTRRGRRPARRAGREGRRPTSTTSGAHERGTGAMDPAKLPALGRRRLRPRRRHGPARRHPRQSRRISAPQLPQPGDGMNAARMRCCTPSTALATGPSAGVELRDILRRTTVNFPDALAAGTVSGIGQGRGPVCHDRRWRRSSPAAVAAEIAAGTDGRAAVRTARARLPRRRRRPARRTEQGAGTPRSPRTARISAALAGCRQGCCTLTVVFAARLGHRHGSTPRCSLDRGLSSCLVSHTVQGRRVGAPPSSPVARMSAAQARYRWLCPTLSAAAGSGTVSRNTIRAVEARLPKALAASTALRAGQGRGPTHHLYRGRHA